MVYLLSRWAKGRRLWAGLVIWLALCHAFGLAAYADQPSSRVGEWRQTQGPAGAKVNALCIDPSRPNVLYAATGAGLYISKDGGDSWRLPADASLFAGEVLAVAVSPREPDRVYASTAEGRILSSADGGAHWQASISGLPPQVLWSLAVHPQTPTLVYAGSDTLYRSQDAGAHWIALSSPFAGARISSIVLHETLGQTIYIGTDKGIYKSADGGQSWTEANQGLPAGISVECLLITQLSASSSQLILCAGANKGVYRSLDGGASWQPAARGLGAASALAYSSAQPFILYGGFPEQGIGRSIDGGDHWDLISPSLDASGVSALALDPGRPNLVYAGTSMGLYRSANMGAKWTDQLRGGPATPGELAAKDRRQAIVELGMLGGLGQVGIEADLAHAEGVAAPGGGADQL